MSLLSPTHHPEYETFDTSEKTSFWTVYIRLLLSHTNHVAVCSALLNAGWEKSQADRLIELAQNEGGLHYFTRIVSSSAQTEIQIAYEYLKQGIKERGVFHALLCYGYSVSHSNATISSALAELEDGSSIHALDSIHNGMSFGMPDIPAKQATKSSPYLTRLPYALTLIAFFALNALFPGGQRVWLLLFLGVSCWRWGSMGYHPAWGLLTLLPVVSIYGCFGPNQPQKQAARDSSENKFTGGIFWLCLLTSMLLGGAVLLMHLVAP
jgi:hypothetical protein